jgi:hypothetical protein
MARGQMASSMDKLAIFPADMLLPLPNERSMPVGQINVDYRFSSEIRCRPSTSAAAAAIPSKYSIQSLRPS